PGGHCDPARSNRGTTSVSASTSFFIGVSSSCGSGSERARLPVHEVRESPRSLFFQSFRVHGESVMNLRHSPPLRRTGGTFAAIAPIGQDAARPERGGVL